MAVMIVLAAGVQPEAPLPVLREDILRQMHVQKGILPPHAHERTHKSLCFSGAGLHIRGDEKRHAYHAFSDQAPQIVRASTQ